MPGNLFIHHLVGFLWRGKYIYIYIVHNAGEEGKWNKSIFGCGKLMNGMVYQVLIFSINGKKKGGWDTSKKDNINMNNSTWDELK